MAGYFWRRTMHALLCLALLASLSGGLCRQERWPELRCRICAAIARVPVLPPAVTGWALNGEGLGREDQGNLPAAGELFERAIHHAPNAARYHNNLGNVRVGMRQPQAAASAYRQAVAHDSTYGRAWLNLGMVKLSMGDVAGARSDVGTAVELQPRAASPLMVRGIIRTMQGDLTRAFEDHTLALALSPDFNLIYSNRACTQIMAGRLILAALDRTYAICPNLPAHPATHPRAACFEQHVFMREMAILRQRIPRQKVQLAMASSQALHCGVPPAHR